MISLNDVKKINGKIIFTVLRSLLVSCVITVVWILGCAYCMMRFVVPEKVLSIGMVFVPILACFLGGILCGKQMKNKRFLWGLSVGVLYFLAILIIRGIMGTTLKDGWLEMITTLLCCGAGGMLGGMLS